MKCWPVKYDIIKPVLVSPRGLIRPPHTYQATLYTKTQTHNTIGGFIYTSTFTIGATTASNSGELLILLLLILQGTHTTFRGVISKKKGNTRYTN